MPDLDEVTRELYTSPPDQFMAKRSELARAAADPDEAKAIQKLRKPTVGAWLVNALVLDDASVVDKLTALGDRLRDAQHALDADRLRTLSTERRELVGRLTSKALQRTGRKQPPAALRDEVSGTLDAAIADPDVAARLGSLQRAEHWSGFGFTGAAPELTLVQGGKSGQRGKPMAGKPKGDGTPEVHRKPKGSAAERRKQQRALDKARSAFTDAEATLADAQNTEQELADRVRTLTRKLAAVQGELDDARGELESARKEVTAARGRRREARSALDRAEREADQ